MRMALVCALLVAGGAFGAQECPLETVDVVTPADGAVIYLDEAAPGLDMLFGAEPGCVDETERVRFSVAVPGGSYTVIGSDTTYPYRIAQNFLGVTFGEAYGLLIEAIPTDEEADTVTTETAFTFQAVSETTDSDANGLPDTPFATLPGNTDQWYAYTDLTDAAFTMVAGAAALYGYPSDAPPHPTTAYMAVANPANTDQVVTVALSQQILEDEERGILLVQVAADIPSLIGSTEANRPDRLKPDTDLDPDGLYVQVSLLVSSDGGATFEEVDDARLVTYPISLTISQLGLVGGEDYSLARYPTSIEQGGSAISVSADFGDWDSVANQEMDFDNDIVSASLVKTGMYGVFQQADVGDGVDTGGTGATTIWTVLFPILVSLGILQLADEGGPCFLATAAYGTPMDQDLGVLRRFRDNTLLTTAAGTLFVDAYYRMSPALADAVAAVPLLAALVRCCLAPVTALLRLAEIVPGLFWALAIVGLTAAVLAKRFRRIRTLK